MAEVIVSGSINDFGFGPKSLRIADGLPAEEEAHAVIDAILQADSNEEAEMTLQRVVRDANASGESPHDRAAHRGFTELEYRNDGRVVRIL